MRLCFVQFGDMREAVDRLAEGGAENYRAQRYSVTQVMSRAPSCEAMCVISLDTDPGYDETRENVRLVGIKAPDYPARQRAVLAAIAEFSPTHIVLRTPMLAVFDWAKRAGIPLFPIMADSFTVLGWGPRSIKKRLGNRRLAAALGEPSVSFVSNHNVAACDELVRIGVDPKKVIPWDWPSEKTPADYAPKRLDSGRRRVLFVGAISEGKGAGDIIDAFVMDDALAALGDLRLIGKGPAVEALKAKAGSRAVFLGRVPNSTVLEEMRAADVVVVPSRHDDPEGLPGTIYEALTVRTPVVLSDHPMFKPYFSEGQGVRFAPGASPAGLASVLKRVLGDEAGYEALSEGTADAFAKIDCPHLWGDVLGHWLSGDEQGYLARHAGRWHEEKAAPPSAD